MWKENDADCVKECTRLAAEGRPPVGRPALPSSMCPPNVPKVK